MIVLPEGEAEKYEFGDGEVDGDVEIVEGVAEGCMLRGAGGEACGAAEETAKGAPVGCADGVGKGADEGAAEGIVEG